MINFKNITRLAYCVFSTIFFSLPVFAEHPIKKVMFVVAMDTEAAPLISTFKLHKSLHTFSNLPMQAYVGKYRNLDILLMVNGMDPINNIPNIGTQAATLTTYLGIEYFHPDLIISIGTAGGVEALGAKQKDIYISQKIYFYDRRLPFKGYHEYGLGDYKSASLAPIDKKIGLKPGVICSGDSFDENKVDYENFIKEKCSVIDMEAAAVAWVSMLTKTPMIAIKGVTNFVRGKDIHDQYQLNLPSVTKELSNKSKELLDYLSQE